MAGSGTITMSMREIDRLKVIQAVVDGNLKPMQAASRLGLTTRQIQRLVNRYREYGAAGLVSRKRGQLGNRQLMLGLASAPLDSFFQSAVDASNLQACETGFCPITNPR